jgi:hypothetical protein
MVKRIRVVLSAVVLIGCCQPSAVAESEQDSNPRAFSNHHALSIERTVASELGEPLRSGHDIGKPVVVGWPVPETRDAPGPGR